MEISGGKKKKLPKAVAFSKSDFQEILYFWTTHLRELER